MVAWRVGGVGCRSGVFIKVSVLVVHLKWRRVSSPVPPPHTTSFREWRVRHNQSFLSRRNVSRIEPPVF
jgi:hypothetical protein